MFKHPVKKDAELTLKERALYAPLFPNVHFLFYSNDTHPKKDVPYEEVGDMPLEVFVKNYSISELKKFRDVGPKTIKILSKILKDAGLEWK